MAFTLPEALPTDLGEVDDLLAAAEADLQGLRDDVDSGDVVTDEQLAELRGLRDAITALRGHRAELVATEQARRDEADSLLAELDGDNGAGDADAESSTDNGDVDGATADAEEGHGGGGGTATPATAVAASGAARKVTFSGAHAGRKPAAQIGGRRTTTNFRMVPGIHGYKDGQVTIRDLADAIDSIRDGGRARPNRANRGSFAAQALARMTRDVREVTSSQHLVEEIERATNEALLPGGSLTAAGGWCAPSETLYTFCEVPNATDLVSLPEITIRRGGVRWPVEPDLSGIFENFEFFYNEAALEEVDPETGEPTAVKECVEVPCPDEFEELRLNAVGYCVRAGILQEQGWPELIEWFLRSLMQEHFRALSRRTVMDMVAGSTGLVIPADSQIAAGSSVINSLALMAVNLRLNKGLGKTATIEGVAPSWLHELIRADLANQHGVETKAVTDAQITAWLTTRHIALQYVGDWQTRSAGLPGNLATTVWPATVEVLLYPAGTWFRAMSNVIELGNLYPPDQLRLNRFTRFFLEDAIAVDKRCNASLNVQIPICPSGAVGARQTIACNTPPVDGGEGE